MPQQHQPGPIIRKSANHLSSSLWEHIRTIVAVIALLWAVSWGIFTWLHPSSSTSSPGKSIQGSSTGPLPAQPTTVPAPTQMALTPVLTSVPTPTPAQTTDALYHANWSTDTDGWSVPSYWRWSNEAGGMLATEPTVPNNAIFAPYALTGKTYKVVATIKLLGFSDERTAGRAYGIVVKKAGQNGYICGVGIHYPPEHFFLGNLAISSAYPLYQIPKDLADQPVNIDNSAWHTYQVDVTDSTMTLSFDGRQIDQVSVSSSAATEQVGIYVDNAAIQIKSFDILA
ncbi:MAG TPA: hypothetical protein VFB60_19630 [Ktedonobacteraceae bacterium]|nr:hypothetical protein [Ktedonobacteraceae bacterium]